MEQRPTPKQHPQSPHHTHLLIIHTQHTPQALKALPHDTWLQPHQHRAAHCQRQSLITAAVHEGGEGGQTLWYLIHAPHHKGGLAHPALHCVEAVLVHQCVQGGERLRSVDGCDGGVSGGGGGGSSTATTTATTATTATKAATATTATPTTSTASVQHPHPRQSPSHRATSAPHLHDQRGSQLSSLVRSLQCADQPLRQLGRRQGRHHSLTLELPRCDPPCCLGLTLLLLFRLKRCLPTGVACCSALLRCCRVHSFVLLPLFEPIALPVRLRTLTHLVDATQQRVYCWAC